MEINTAAKSTYMCLAMVFFTFGNLWPAYDCFPTGSDYIQLLLYIYPCVTYTLCM